MRRRLPRTRCATSRLLPRLRHQHYELEVGKAIVAVLEHNGFEVILPEQNCCGLPMQSNGDFDGARRYARANLRKLAPYAGPGHPHRGRRHELRAGAEVGLPRDAGHPHGGGEAGWPSTSTTSTSSCGCSTRPGRLRPTSCRRRTLPPVPHLLSPEAAPHRPARARPAGAGAGPDASRRWASTAAASPAPTATSTRSTTSPSAVGQPLFDRSWHRAPIWPSATTRPAAGTWRNTGLDVVHTVEVLAEAYGLT